MGAMPRFVVTRHGPPFQCPLLNSAYLGRQSGPGRYVAAFYLNPDPEPGLAL